MTECVATVQRYMRMRSGSATTELLFTFGRLTFPVHGILNYCRFCPLAAEPKFSAHTDLLVYIMQKVLYNPAKFSMCNCFLYVVYFYAHVCAFIVFG